MASNKLTKAKIDNLRDAAMGKREHKDRCEPRVIRAADGEGLYLHAEPSGGLYWRIAYRFGDPAKQKTLSFGVYPAVDLLTARKKRDAAKDELRAGRDPGASFKGIKFGGVTFGELAAEVLAKMERERKAEAALKKNRWLSSAQETPYLT